MYRNCRLVHADLSEYNILFYKGKLYIIDVSQSVEHDHPHALDFLRKDLTNVTMYFSKRIRTLTIRELFDFTTGLDLADDEVDAFLATKRAEVELRPADYGLDNITSVEEEVFKNSYIPRNLFEVIDVEKDAFKAGTGAHDALLYRNLTGLHLNEDEDVAARAGLEEVHDSDDDESSVEDSDSDSDADSDADSDDEDRFQKGKPLDKDERKARKKATKEANRERRKTKLKKHIKKRSEKVSRAH